ncbi:PH domain-containing protein [Aphelenchoides besseyi]|nr:PH domain-containing protein [Aphelenchoides besseyi]KAI6201940.1 PH domain-containing protein [Aphelenchoides besseyi]
MLVNGRSLLSIIDERSYDRRISGRLKILQDERWRDIFALLKANLLFIFEDEQHLRSPIVLIIIEDCTVEPADDNETGMSYSFILKSKTTKRVFTFCANDFKSLEQWVHYLTVSSLDYMNATIQTMLAQQSNDKTTTDVETKIKETTIE